MKTIRALSACALFFWMVIPILILAALFCDESEQSQIGDALFHITRAIGGNTKDETA